MGDRYNKKKAFKRIKQMEKERNKKHGRLSQKEIKFMTQYRQLAK